MSRLSLQQGNHLRARAYLQRYVSVGRHTPETLWLGVQIERELGDKKALASYSSKLRKDFPDSDEAGKLDKTSR
jgi:type IV pilus assembly protein PilF